MGMFNFKEGEMNEKDEDIIGRVLHYLDSAEVNKNINTQQFSQPLTAHPAEMPKYKALSVGKAYEGVKTLSSSKIRGASFGDESENITDRQIG